MEAVNALEILEAVTLAVHEDLITPIQSLDNSIGFVVGDFFIFIYEDRVVLSGSNQEEERRKLTAAIDVLRLAFKTPLRLEDGLYSIHPTRPIDLSALERALVLDGYQ